jgi:hypothetical protein
VAGGRTHCNVRDGAPVLLWLADENRDKKQIPFGDDSKRGKNNSRGKDHRKLQQQEQRQKQNAGVLRYAQNDKPKKRQQVRATVQCLVDGLHPTHRKVRDGWGTRTVVDWQRRMDNNKTKASAEQRQMRGVLWSLTG